MGGLATERSEGSPEEYNDEGKTGGVAEWLKAAVLKTVVGIFSTVSSNLTPTAS